MPYDLRQRSAQAIPRNAKVPVPKFVFLAEVNYERLVAAARAATLNLILDGRVAWSGGADRRHKNKCGPYAYQKVAIHKSVLAETAARLGIFNEAGPSKCSQRKHDSPVENDMIAICYENGTRKAGRLAYSLS